jgi:drug/metabolite transporter (DMT)-like permease
VIRWSLRDHPLFWPYLALVLVCVAWGTTYLAIRIALESVPPFLLVSGRFLISGSLMLGFALAKGLYLPRGRELVTTCCSGVLILAVGNGCLVLSEMLIPSGMAGLLVTLSPFWLVGMEAAMPGGEKLHGPTLAGMAVGFSGVVLLFSPGVGGSFDRNMLYGFLLLQLGSLGWNFGSIYQRRQEGRAHPVIAGAVQQLAAGVATLPVVLIMHERIPAPTLRGVAAVLYLVVFGSIVGYSAYAYALDRLPVALVSIYPYANAVVAVSLGWLFYREPFGARETAAMAVIFAGVAIVKRCSRR